MTRLIKFSKFSQINDIIGFPLGVIGFDVDRETIGACRGVDVLVNPATQL